MTVGFQFNDLIARGETAAELCLLISTIHDKAFMEFIIIELYTAYIGFFTTISASFVFRYSDISVRCEQLLVLFKPTTII